MRHTETNRILLLQCSIVSNSCTKDGWQLRAAHRLQAEILPKTTSLMSIFRTGLDKTLRQHFKTAREIQDSSTSAHVVIVNNQNN